MAILTLPVDQDAPWYQFTITLDDASYTIEMAFNTRAERWMLTLSDAVGTPVVASIPVLIQRDLLSPFRTLAVPPGYLIAGDTTGQQQQPTLGSFLLNHRLYYVEEGTVL